MAAAYYCHNSNGSQQALRRGKRPRKHSHGGGSSSRGSGGITRAAEKVVVQLDQTAAMHQHQLHMHQLMPVLKRSKHSHSDSTLFPRPPVASTSQLHAQQGASATALPSAPPKPATPGAVVPVARSALPPPGSSSSSSQASSSIPTPPSSHALGTEASPVGIVSSQDLQQRFHEVADKLLSGSKATPANTWAESHPHASRPVINDSYPPNHLCHWGVPPAVAAAYSRGGEFRLHPWQVAALQQVWVLGL